MHVSSTAHLWNTKSWDEHINDSLSESNENCQLMSNKQAVKVCFCFRRIFRPRAAEPPEDIKQLFDLYSANGTMTIDHFHAFLKEFQGETKAPLEDAAKVFEQLISTSRRKGLSLDAFFRYLLGDLNHPVHLKVHHDMNSPLCHYFIFTGHNSYLTGTQFTSDVSVQPITDSLLRGVRVVELDLWPKGKDGVEVRHLWSLSPAVELINCLRAIKENAFASSKYPVFITFEDHLTPSLQAKVVKMVTEVFGDMQYCPLSNDLMEFPSPESLKERILISIKPPQYQDDDQGKNQEHSLVEYKQLITVGEMPRDEIDMLDTDSYKLRRLSLNDQELENKTTTGGIDTDIVRFTARNLLRIYPKGKLLGSSNYDPMLGWMHGAQTVACNMQGWGKHLWLMQGLFRANGGCGYVKKPDFLLDAGPNNEVFDPQVELPIKTVLKVKVYMGEGWHSDFRLAYFDLHSAPLFSVTVGISGVKGDVRLLETRAIEDEWIPVWNEEFSFPLSVPELAVIGIEVKQRGTAGKDNFGGQTFLPVSEMKTGIRAVPLLDQRGQKYKSVKLLMRFEFETKYLDIKKLYDQKRKKENDIKKVFNQYAENGTMTIANFQVFLIEFQRESSTTKEDAQAIFNSFKHLNIFQRRNGLDFDAFFSFLLSDLNPPHYIKVNHDMNAPMAHYFLFTGHNSYLTGNQLSSDSSVHPIINALLQGVRVIELDLWPNPTKNGVEVRHGGTLTNPVELIKCLRAIKVNAFVASEYPVVITFEDHLTAYLQAKVAKMVTETFGGMLYSPHSEYIMEFPSPESLKGRILISTKSPEYHESQRHMERATDNMDTVRDDQDDEDEEGHAIPEYKELIAIHAGKQKGGLDMWYIDPIKVRRLSLSEQELENAARTRGSDIVRFTQRNLLRVYPKGVRLDSSNYDPMLGWAHGAQMVAFNMQGHGKHLWIMQGMFRANGGCGYVKKPDFLLSVSPNNAVFDPDQTLPVKTNLKVNVYRGEGWRSDFGHTHFDLYSPPDFYVRVGIAGVPKDKKTMETQPVEDQWVPEWNEEFSFPLSVPELAVLRVEVREYDISGKQDFGGQTCLPIPELRTGIRAVPLYNKGGLRYKSVRLLMRFQFDE